MEENFVGSPILGEGFVDGLEQELCGQEEKKGLENNFSLPFLENSKGTQLKNLWRAAMHWPISQGLLCL